MTARVGLVWAFAFVLLEAIQFVFFGNVFQRVSSVLFGALVLGTTVAAFVGWTAVYRSSQLHRAFSMPWLLLAINVTALLSWLMFLMAVQLIEPAVAYALGAGAMPLAAWAAHQLGIPEGEAMRNRMEAIGNTLIGAALVYLLLITTFGASGFTRGGAGMATLGALLALTEGALFTWLLILCQRIDRAGVKPGALFGLRFPLYVLTAGTLAAMGFDAKEAVPWSELAVIVALGLLLIVPPLYALQQAVSHLSTLTISAITALGPFFIFALQMAEGRVSYSTPTLIGLGIYYVAAITTALGALKASRGAGRTP